jgi:hypothetical protein
MSHSPWGHIQDSTQIEKGVRWVSTASHGGLMVANDAAKALLSARAIEIVHCTESAAYVCFEEDCEYAIAFFEHPEWERVLQQKQLDEWRELLQNTWSHPPASYMANAAAEAIPKIEARLRMTDHEIREEMRAIVQRWNPEYFGLPNKCGACGAELPASKGNGFVLCDGCEAARRPSKQVALFATGNQRGMFE